MADASKKSSKKSETPPSTLEDQTLETLLNWLHTIDPWTVGGVTNKLPRWIYLVIGLIIFV